MLLESGEWAGWAQDVDAGIFSYFLGNWLFIDEISLNMVLCVCGAAWALDA